MNDKDVNLDMPEALYEKLKKAAAERSLPTAAYIRMVLSDNVRNKKL